MKEKINDDSVFFNATVHHYLGTYQVRYSNGRFSNESSLKDAVLHYFQDVTAKLFKDAGNLFGWSVTANFSDMPGMYCKLRIVFNNRLLLEREFETNSENIDPARYLTEKIYPVMADIVDTLKSELTLNPYFREIVSLTV